MEELETTEYRFVHKLSDFSPQIILQWNDSPNFSIIYQFNFPFRKKLQQRSKQILTNSMFFLTL